MMLPLSVEEPKVSISPPVQTFIVGSRVDIYCSAVAYPKPVFSWRRKQQSLEISDRVSYDTEGHLIIVEASHDDVGEWECVAQNPLGVGSATASLEHIGTKWTSIHAITFWPFYYIFGFEVSCAANIDSLKGQCLLRIKTSSVEPTLFICLETDSRNCFQMDEMLHSLHCTLPFDSIYSELPSIHIPSRNVLVNSGDTAQLICVADGIPQPNVTWKRGGIEVTRPYI